jgi:hypothetical protein
MRFIGSVAVGVMLVWSSSPVLGETYQWEDAQGVVHFTDNAEKIPAKYRNRVRQRESLSVEPRTASPTPDPALPTVAGDQKKKERLTAGQTAEAWQQRFLQLQQELASATTLLEEKKAELQRAHRAYVISLGAAQAKYDKNKKDMKGYALNTIAAKRKAYYDLLAEIPQAEERVKALNDKVQALQAEAEAAGVPAPVR